MEYTIKNARILDGAIVDVEIANGVIKNIGSGLNSGEILDANKNLLIPGLVDLHTHYVNLDGRIPKLLQLEALLLRKVALLQYLRWLILSLLLTLLVLLNKFSD